MGSVQANTADRQALYNRLLEETEVEVEEDEIFNNPNNVIDDDTNEKVFTPINEVVSMEEILAMPAVAVLRFRAEMG